MSFAKTDAQVKPLRACLGYLKSIGPVAHSKNDKSSYFVCPFELEGKYGSMNIKGRLVFTPEMFDPSWNPKEHEDQTFVYTSNVYGPDSPSALMGLCGSEDIFEKLAELKDQHITNFNDSEEIGQFLTNFFTELGHVDVGYILKQQREKLEDGTYILRPFYEVGAWFYPSEKAIARLIKRADKYAEDPSATPFKIGFDLKAAGIN